MTRSEASQSEISTGLALSGQEPDQQPDLTVVAVDQIAPEPTAPNIPAPDIPSQVFSSDAESNADISERRAKLERLNAISARLVERVKADDREAFERLWAHIFPFVVSVARKQRSYLPLDEKIQVAALQITARVSQYDPTLSTFSDFVRFNVGVAIKEEERRILRSNGLVRSDYRKLTAAAKADKPTDEVQALVRDGFTHAPHLIRGNRVKPEAFSLEAALENDSHEDGATDSKLPRSRDDTFEQAAELLAAEELERLIDRLPGDQQIVIRYRYGTGDREQLTNERIAEVFLRGVSSARVAQLHTLAIQNLTKLANGADSVPNRFSKINPQPAEVKGQAGYLQKLRIKLDRLNTQNLSWGELERFLLLFPEWNHQKQIINGSSQHLFDRDTPDEPIVFSFEAVNDGERIATRDGTKVLLKTAEPTVNDLIRIVQIEQEIDAYHTARNQSLESTQSPAVHLKPRQLEVLENLYMPTTILAEKLGIGASTVRTHFHAIMRAFGVHSKRELAVEAAKTDSLDQSKIPRDRTQSLTAYEKDLLAKYYALSIEEIAETINKPIGTLRVHFMKIYRKIDATDRTEATFFAIVDGLIPSDAEDTTS